MPIANFITTALLLSVLSQISYGETRSKGYDIVTEANKRDQGFGDQSAEVEMILRNKAGEVSKRKLSIKTLEGKQGEDKSLVTFYAPGDIKGTKLLTHAKERDADQQWLYLPAIKKTKRIVSSRQTGPFVGSEFSYEDMTAHIVNKFTYKFIEARSCGINTCHVVECYPKEEDSGYQKKIIWFEQETLRTEKIEYFDRKGAILKTMEARGFKKYDKFYWRPNSLFMHNNQTGKSTEMIWSNYSFKQGLSNREFAKKVLKHNH